MTGNQGQPTWNVLVPVVELITAQNASEAVRILESRLAAAGFDAYDEGSHAFRSEDLPEDDLIAQHDKFYGKQPAPLPDGVAPEEDA